MNAVTDKPVSQAQSKPFELGAAQREQVAGIIASYRDVPGGMLPLLHAVQDALGWLPPEVVPDIAHAMNRSRAEVHGVISFYHHFRSQPAGQHVVQVCVAEACKACGGDALMQAAERALGCAAHGTRGDGQVTLEPVYCLGLCAASPAMQIDDRLHARVDVHKLHRLVNALNQTIEDQA
jgi:formate dehydrogenase subunit gamma